MGWGAIAQEAPEPEQPPPPIVEEEALDTTIELRPEPDVPEDAWFVFIGHMRSHSRLDQAAEDIDAEINGLFQAIAPGFDDVRTFEDQRDGAGIIIPIAAVGKVLNEHWDVFLQVGYSEGKVRTEQSNISWLLWPLNSDVILRRSSFLVGVGVDYYPWGMARLGDYDTIGARLRNARPFVASTLNWNHLTFEADIKAGPWPFSSLIKIKDERDWDIWNVGVTAGVDVPLGAKSTLSANVSYSFFFEEHRDFNGFSLIFYWKRYF
jgi:hypothetical protein